MAKKGGSLLGALRGIITGDRGDDRTLPARGSERLGRGGDLASRRDLLAPYAAPVVDLDPLVHPTKHQHPTVPPVLQPGALLVSQRHGVKALLLEPLEEVDIAKLKDLCLRKLPTDQVAYLPMGTQVLKDEVLHQGRQFVVRLRKGTIYLSPGGHPNAYLLDAISLPLTKEVSSNWQILLLTEAVAKKHLQRLVEIPPNFKLIKEDVLFDESITPFRIEKGSLVISRGGALTGFMLEDVQLPIRKSVAELEALFPLKSTYQSLPIETLMQRAARTGGKGLVLDRGTFLFSPQGKVYFVWKEGLHVSTSKLQGWARAAQIVEQGVLNVSTTKNNIIGGAGHVITQEEINYIRDVFRQAGSTNIYRDTLLLDNNVFYKFVHDMPYAQTGKFRSYLATGGVVMLNTFRKGTFSAELGGKEITLTDLDLQRIRESLGVTGRVLIKMGTLLRIRDERQGDWIYKATNNLFYPYETLTRPYLEEFIPESVAFKERAEKTSTIIGPQDKPKPEDRGASGEPLGDLLALINNELNNDRVVFVLDGTLFHWKGRLYRVNEELVFRPQEYDKVAREDLDALEAEWKIHPLVEDVAEHEEPTPVPDDADEDLENLPFDTGSGR